MTSPPAQSEPHVRAVVDLLNTALAALPTPIKAYSGRRLDSDQNCVVVHGSPGDISGPLGDRFADIDIPIQITAVATGQEQVLAYADAARRALLTMPLTVSGRAMWPPWPLASQPAVRDETVNPPLWIATAQYQLKSNPA